MNCVELLAAKKGKGLIAFSDPAGAKASLALHWILTNVHGLENYTIGFQQETIHFSADWNAQK